jgi:hypothetical protein
MLHVKLDWLRPTHWDERSALEFLGYRVTGEEAGSGFLCCWVVGGGSAWNL